MEEYKKMERQEYEVEYKCGNCGHLFKVNLRKGLPAKGAAGDCPNCGIPSGKPGIGEHQMVWPEAKFAVGGREILHG